MNFLITYNHDKLLQTHQMNNAEAQDGHQETQVEGEGKKKEIRKCQEPKNDVTQESNCFEA